MNILFLAYEPPYPANDGGRIRTYNLLKQAAKRHSVTLVAFENLTNPYDWESGLQPYCTAIHVLPRTDLSTRPRWEKITQFFSRDPASFRAFNSVNLAHFLSHLSEQKKFDLVHFDQIYMTQYHPIFPSVPSVENHNDIDAELLRQSLMLHPNRCQPRWWFYWIDYWRLRRYEMDMMARMDVNLVVSELNAHYIRHKIPTACVQVVPNGVDTDFFQPMPNLTPGMRLLFPGRLDYEPNVDAILWFFKDIWPEISRLRPEAVLMIVGRDPIPEIKELGNWPGVFVVGSVPDIRPYYDQSDVVIVPLRNGSGTRIKILEAMAMQKPVVSTKLGAEGLDVSDGYDILIADDAPAFTKKVLNLLDDPNYGLKLGCRARKTVEMKYDWNNIGDALDAAYQIAVQKRVI